MDRADALGGYRYLTGIRIPLDRGFVTAGPLTISLASRDLDAGEGELYYVWKKLMLGTGAARDESSPELEKLRDLGYIN